MSKKSRRLINSAQAGPAPVAPVQPTPVTPDPQFWFLPDAPPQPVNERDLHDLMQQWRHGRATRSIWGFAASLTSIVCDKRSTVGASNICRTGKLIFRMLRIRDVT